MGRYAPTGHRRLDRKDPYKNGTEVTVGYKIRIAAFIIYFSIIHFHFSITSGRNQISREVYTYLLAHEQNRVCAASSTYFDPIVWYTSLGPIAVVFTMSPTAQNSGGSRSIVVSLRSPISGPLVFNAGCISPTMSLAPDFAFVVFCCYCLFDLQPIAV